MRSGRSYTGTEQQLEGVLGSHCALADAWEKGTVVVVVAAAGREEEDERGAC